MTDDILTQLQRIAYVMFNDGWQSKEVAPIAMMEIMALRRKSIDRAIEIERLEKVLQTAREALEPFAARAKKWDLNGDSARVSVKLGDLRRAADAIRALQKKEG